MKTGRKVGRPYYANCWVVMRVLKYRGKISKIKKIKKGHYIGLLTGKDRWVHFKAINPRLRENPYKSGWKRRLFLLKMIVFKGHLEVLEKKVK